MATTKNIFRLIICMACYCVIVGFMPELQGQGGWSKPVDLSNESTDNIKSYGIMVCDKYQNLHFFWGDNSDEGAVIYYRSDLWDEAKDVILIDEYTIGSPSVVIDHDDMVHITWVTAQFGGNMYYTRAPLSRLSDSRAWQPARIQASNVVNSVIEMDPSGVLHLVYAVSDPEGLIFDVLHTESTDQGFTWSDPSVVYSRVKTDPFTIYTSMDIDESGRIHLGLTIRSQTYGDYSEVGYLRSLDRGKTWSVYQEIASQNEASPNIALIGVYAFGRDEIHLTWHDPRRMHLWSYNGGTTFAGPDEIMPLGGAFGGFNELVKDGNGDIHAIVAVADGVYSVTWSNRQWKKPEQIDNRWIDPHGQHISICQGNLLSVIFYDRTGETTEWLSQKTLAAPHLEREPIPTLLPMVQANATITPVTTQAALPDVSVTATPLLDQVNSGNPLPFQTVILAGSLPSLLVIGLIFAYRKSQRR